MKEENVKNDDSNNDDDDAEVDAVDHFCQR